MNAPVVPIGVVIPDLVTPVVYSDPLACVPLAVDENKN
jgi:hypothetical protein